MIFGAVVDENMRDRVRITVIATGFDRTVPRRHLVDNRSQERPRPVSRPQSIPQREPVRQMPSRQTERDTQERETPRTIFGRPLAELDRDDLDLPTFLRNR